MNYRRQALFSFSKWKRTNNQAFTSGIAAGFAEVLFEKFSVDNLLKGVRDSTFFKSLLKQGGIEASEEMATEVANILSDAAIMGQSSRFHEAVRAYMELGQVSEEEAEKKAFLDCVADVGLAGLGGFLSGGSSMAMIGGSQLAADRLLGNKKAASGEAASKYTKEEANAIRYEGKTFRNLVAGIDSSVSAFVEKWKNGRKSHLGEKLEKLYLGKMTNQVKEQVSKILEYEVAERDFIITNDDVKHMVDHHGDGEYEEVRGNIPLERWMFDCLPDIVCEPDSVRSGGKGRGKKNAGKKAVLFSKSFPGGTVITVQFDNRGRKTMELVTLYAKKNDGTISEPYALPASAVRPERSESVPSAVNIPRSSAKVNESQLEQDPFLQGFNEGESEETGLGTAVEGWEDDPFLQGFYEEDEGISGARTSTGDREFRKALEIVESGGRIEVNDVFETEIATKPFSEVQPFCGKLPNRTVRKWYLFQDANIPNQVKNLSGVEQQAREACKLRNQNRTWARELMEDQGLRRKLDETDPNKTFEELLASKMLEKKLTREQAVEDILKTATKTRKEVNKKYGLE